MRLDVYTTQPHYAAHVGPVWEQLPPQARGRWYRTIRDYRQAKPDGRPVLVAAYGDLRVARSRGGPIVYMEHGCGLSYSTDHPSYAGGRDRAGVVLLLSPNRYVADRNVRAYPELPQRLVGCPKLDPVWTAPRKLLGDPPLVAISFHWDCLQAPEARSALRWYQPALRLLARQASVHGWQVVGHGHPRAMPALRKLYQAWDIPVQEEFAGILATADLYVVDNSSTLYEFAATGRPVLTLNAPWYRRHVHHGLRFWEHVPGLQVARPAQLQDGITRALADGAELRALRVAAVEAVYPVGRDGTAARIAAGYLERLLAGRKLGP